MSEEKCKYQNQTFGFVFCGEYNNQTYCCDVEDCYFKQNKRLREALEKINNDRYGYTCDYSDCTCWNIAQQALGGTCD